MERQFSVKFAVFFGGVLFREYAVLSVLGPMSRNSSQKSAKSFRSSTSITNSS